MGSDWHDIGAVVDWIRELRHVDTLALVGWSQGGPRAGGYAAQHPAKVSRLVVLAPAYGRTSAAEAPNPLPAIAGPMTAQSRADFVANWDRQVGCPDQYDPAVSAAVWSAMLASDPVGATWGPGVRRAPQVPSWGFNQAVVAKMQTPALLVTGAHDKQVAPERVHELYADLGSPLKVVADLACSSHNAMWERNHLLLFEASLEWLRDGKVNGMASGEVRLGYSPGAAQPAVTHPYDGITYIQASATAPRPVHVHVIQIDLGTPGIRLMLTPPSGARETVRETTEQFVNEVHAQAGINAHYFLPFPSADSTAWLIGLAASDGRVFSAFESPAQSFALVADAPAINIDRANHASIVHRDPARPDGLHVREAVELWTTIAGSAEIVTAGAVTIPQYRDAAHPDGELTSGGPRNYGNGHSWYDAVTARSAIGLSKDGRTLTLFTVDARGGSEGMTVGEAASWLVEKDGVWDALNVDGGGSTSLVLADPATGRAALVNTSSDNPGGRSVGSSLAVFARPGRAPGGH
jgi:hypothetical protein